MNVPKVDSQVPLPSKRFLTMPPAVFLWAIMTKAVLVHLFDVASHGFDGAPAMWATSRHRRRLLTLGGASTGLL